MRRRGKNLRPTPIGKRTQYAPGELIRSLDPSVRRTIERLAATGYGHAGRGALFVELNDEVEGDIAQSEYFPLAQLEAMSRSIPFAQAQAFDQVVKTYDPAIEFVAIVMDASPSLPGPNLWFERFPRQLLNDEKPLQNQHSITPPPNVERVLTSASEPRRRPRGRQVPPPTPKQEATMATAYALIEDMARAGYAEQGRGFVLNALFPDRGQEPFVRYLTLEDEVGRTFVSTMPDLVQMVHTYDPSTSFVVFDGTINMKNMQIEQAQVDIFTFLTGKSASSA